MRLIYSMEEFGPGGCAAALGTFDGLHIGHQALIYRAMELAKELDAASIVCTFDAHPLRLLCPERAPVPLMTLERCINKQAAGCTACTQGKAQLVDRRGVRFPVVREFGHRNLVLNSLPTGMSDKEGVLHASGITARHFLFTVESGAEVDRVIAAYKKGTALPYPVRRI